MVCHSVQKLLQDQLALDGEAVKAFVALVLFAPLAGQQPLAFQAAQQRVKRAFVDGQPQVIQGLAQRVAIVLLPELGQYGDDQAAAAKLQLEVLKEFVITWYWFFIQCVIHTM